MLNSLYIKDFKCLKDFQIDNLSSVNLIIGKNNVGKSTLLEAVAINADGEYQLFDLSSSGGENNDKYWEIISLKQKEIVIEALRIIEPGIERLHFVENEIKRIPVVKLKYSSTFCSLGSMGKGINRIFTYILAMVNVPNGILLIDEIENGLHYTTQELLWKTIFKLSKELKVQVFATTHSDDCIYSFGKVLNETHNLQGQLIRLEKKNEKNIRVTKYDVEELDVIYKQGIEVR